MANKKISELTSYSTPVSADVIPINDTANNLTKKITIANLLNVLSSLFTIKDSSDTTKKVAFDVSGVTTATTRTLVVPNANTTIVGTDVAQTLTNKTLGTGTKMALGSDATGDIYYNSGSGTVARLPVSTDGKILKLSSGLPSWQTETTTSDASTTVKGIVEAATAAEVTSGTATGGTGAVLVVTPDALASSTPVFDGSGITNISGKIAITTTDVTISNTSVETNIVSQSISGGILGTNNAVRVTMHLSSVVTGQATGTDTFTFRFKYGGTTLTTLVLTPTAASTYIGKIEFILAGAGTTSSQNGSYACNIGESTYAGAARKQYFAESAQGTSSIDSTSSQTLLITGQYSNANASNVATISLIVIEKIK